MDSRELGELTSAAFAPLVSETFELTPPGGQPLQIVLTSCEEMAGGSPAGHRTPFSLIFHAPSGHLVPQQICELRHPRLGGLELFIVPLGPDERGMRYQVVFG